MKTILTVVWLLSNGSLQGEPWKEFPDIAKCEEVRLATKSADDKLLFLTGCLDASTLPEFTAFEMKLFPRDKP